MRILHVITTVNRGGAENHLVDLCREQVSAGHHVAVAYLKGDRYWQAELDGMGAHPQCLDLKRYGEIGPVLRLRRMMRTFDPDIVHAHMPPAELYARLALFLFPGRRSAFGLQSARTLSSRFLMRSIAIPASGLAVQKRF